MPNAPTVPSAPPDLTAWLADRRNANDFDVQRIPFEEMTDWGFESGTGNLVHRSGRFFTVAGLHVRSNYGPVREWRQPIIVQPEFGILGILIRRIGGVVHCLMQAKMEPGNINGLQLSPTVQATRSNYMRVHRGNGTRYLDFFTTPGRGRVLIDVLQSEQGVWFYQKRNRNMIVETDEDVPPHDDFNWLPLEDVWRLLREDNLVNMDVRSVLSCLPLAVPDWLESGLPRDEFAEAVHRSFTGLGGSHRSGGQILNWFTEVKSACRTSVRQIPLARVTGWRRTSDAIDHEDGRYFRVIAVNVRTSNREVRRWSQPLIAPRGEGIAAFLAKRIDGVLHVLAHARVEPGFLDVVELAPTVLCNPANYAGLPPENRPPFLDKVLHAEPEKIRYTALLSEEGGRFHHAQTRYLLVEVDEDELADVPPHFQWMTLRQLTDLLRHSHYLNVQARSLLACLNAV